MFKNPIPLKSLTKVVCTAPIVLAVTVLAPASTQAQVQSTPSDTKQQAGCLSGYPDGTYRGDRPMTRYEFAAGLNACLEGVNQLLPPNRDNLATRADFEALIKRQRELNEQLRELNERVGSRSERQL